MFAFQIRWLAIPISCPYKGHITGTDAKGKWMQYNTISGAQKQNSIVVECAPVGRIVLIQ